MIPSRVLPGRWLEGVLRLLEFARLQALSCLFPGLILLALALSRVLELPLARYDVLLLVGLAGQAAMLASRLETRDELKVILVFHVLGLALELFKVRMGSWSYPEPAFAKLGGVPLYSGFMYASVASYLCQAWRRLDVELRGWPPGPAPALLAGGVYLNFFTHHFLPDLRWLLVGLVVAVFWRARAAYRVRGATFEMPLPLAFLLIGFFVYLAENVATYFGAWHYPHQAAGWQPVGLGKLGSWALLIIVSFIVVASLKRVKGNRSGG